MADYRWVYDSRHLQADCQEPELAPEDRNPTLCNRVWTTFTFTFYIRPRGRNYHRSLVTTSPAILSHVVFLALLSLNLVPASAGVRAGMSPLPGGR